MRRGLFLGVIFFAICGEAGAQCKVGGGSNEGKLLAFYTAPIVFSMAGAPEVLAPATIRIGGEGEYIPKPNRAIEQTGKASTHLSRRYLGGRGLLWAGHSASRSKRRIYRR